MTTGNLKVKVTRTDTARYLNMRHEDFPELAKRWELYMSSCGRARKADACQFGFWLRSKYPRDFQKVFAWAKKHHCEVLDIVYADTDSAA